MMYYEFLEGTQAPDNACTYKQYVELEKLYNSNDSYSKEDIYKMYVAPDPMNAYLLEVISDLKYQCFEYRSEIRQKDAEIERLQEDNRRLKANPTMPDIIEEVLKKMDNCRREINGMLYD